MSDEFWKMFDYMLIIENSWVDKKTKKVTLKNLEDAIANS